MSRIFKVNEDEEKAGKELWDKVKQALESTGITGLSGKSVSSIDFSNLSRTNVNIIYQDIGTMKKRLGIIEYKEKPKDYK